LRRQIPVEIKDSQSKNKSPYAKFNTTNLALKLLEVTGGPVEPEDQTGVGADGQELG